MSFESVCVDTCLTCTGFREVLRVMRVFDGMLRDCDGLLRRVEGCSLVVGGLLTVVAGC